jgi:hypothetical protein
LLNSNISATIGISSNIKQPYFFVISRRWNRQTQNVSKSL